MVAFAVSSAVSDIAKVKGHASGIACAFGLGEVLAVPELIDHINLANSSLDFVDSVDCASTTATSGAVAVASIGADHVTGLLSIVHLEDDSIGGNRDHVARIGDLVTFVAAGRAGEDSVAGIGIAVSVHASDPADG